MTKQMTHHQTSIDVTQSPQGGQTMVLMVLMIVGLLAFVGLAADVGFLFARSSQFSSAVDSAALAGVIEMDPTAGNLVDADNRSQEFLAANGWAVTPDVTFVSTSTLTAQGIPQYTITVTWPVDTFFMGILGFDDIPVTRSATAVFYAQSEIYIPSAFERGQIRQASQFVLGPTACTKDGDPVLPNRSTTSEPNADAAHLDGLYRYRIRLTSDYASDSVRVELFDPDSVNLTSGSSNLAYTHSNDAGGATASDGSCSSGWGQACVFETGENLQARSQNPYWFVRVDENFDDNCQAEAHKPNGDTATKFELYYYDGDGERTSWATYTNKSTGASDTDMKWVTPGVTPNVTVDSGSPQSSFDVDVAAVPEADDDEDTRYVYLDVKTMGGSARNVWDVRAGSPGAGLPANVNDRNLELANNPTAYREEGVTVFAVGRMPVQHWIDDHETTLPVAPIDSSYGGSSIYTTIFDYDMAHPKVLIFTIDSVSSDDFQVPIQIVSSNPDPLNGSPTCSDGTTCNNSWWQPQVRLGVPTGSFFGGDLQATYVPRRNAHTWSLAITAGAPILTR